MVKLQNLNSFFARFSYMQNYAKLQCYHFNFFCIQIFAVIFGINFWSLLIKIKYFSMITEKSTRSNGEQEKVFAIFLFCPQNLHNNYILPLNYYLYFLFFSLIENNKKKVNSLTES